MSSDSSDDDGLVVNTTKTDRISVALLGVREIVCRKTPWFADIEITQVGKTYMFAPIKPDFNHLIFFNSKLLRISSNNLNLSSIVPRTVMTKYAPILRSASIGDVYYADSRFFICIDESPKLHHNQPAVLEGFKTVIRLCENAKTPLSKKFFYVSNGGKKWKVQNFTSLRDDITEMQNLIVSWNKHRYDTDDKGIERTTKSGQRRAKPLPARGECWTTFPYTADLKLMNPVIDADKNKGASKTSNENIQPGPSKEYTEPDLSSSTCHNTNDPSSKTRTKKTPTPGAQHTESSNPPSGRSKGDSSGPSTKSWAEYEAELDENILLLEMGRAALQSYNQKSMTAAAEFLFREGMATPTIIDVQRESDIIDVVTKKILGEQCVRDIQEMTGEINFNPVVIKSGLTTMEDEDAPLKDRIAVITQGPPEGRERELPYMEVVDNSTDDTSDDEDGEEDDEGSTDSEPEDNVVHPKKKVKILPDAKDKGKAWVERLPKATRSDTGSTRSTDLEILEMSHRQILGTIPKKTLRKMGASDSRDSFKSAVDLYTSEPLDDAKFVASPVIKTPERIGCRTRSKTAGLSEAREQLKKTGQAFRNRKRDESK